MDCEVMGVANLYAHPDLYGILMRLKAVLKMPGHEQGMIILCNDPNQVSVTFTYQGDDLKEAEVKSLLNELSFCAEEGAKVTLRYDGETEVLYLGNEKAVRKFRSREALETIQEAMDYLLPEDRELLMEELPV